MPVDYAFDVNYIFENSSALIDGLIMTVQVSAISIGLAASIGIVGAAILIFEVPVLNKIVTGYVHFMRSTPMLPQIFFIFYGLASIGLALSTYWSGVLALSLWGGAYNTENVRGGFISISKGLREAANSLGFKPIHYLILVAIPMGLRVSIPSMLNTSVSVLKNSAYLSTIALPELMYVAMERVALDFRTLEMFAAIGVLYLGLVLTLSFLARRVESYLKKPFRVT